MRIGEVWSGGQTGVDRAALDVALSHHLPTAGWVPLGRLAEDGQVPLRYPGLRETVAANADRTTLNVQDSEATLILYRSHLTGGSAFTREEATRLGRPCLAVDLAACSPDEAITVVRGWLSTLAGSRLNVAGPRASSDPGLYHLAAAVLDGVLPQGRNTAAAP